MFNKAIGILRDYVIMPVCRLIYKSSKQPVVDATVSPIGRPSDEPPVVQFVKSVCGDGRYLSVHGGWVDDRTYKFEIAFNRRHNADIKYDVVDKTWTMVIWMWDGGLVLLYCSADRGIGDAICYVSERCGLLTRLVDAITGRQQS